MGRAIEQKGKRTHGHGQQWGDYRGYKWVNGNGKNAIKNKFKKEKTANFKYCQGHEQ